MNCPVCDERVREIEKYGVHLEVCPSCKGVWLEKGSLEKLMEVAAAGAGRSSAGASEAPHSRGRDHEDKGEHRDKDHGDYGSENRGPGERKKKGSWLGDILGGLGGGD
jgi:Zn-finger nucleic acid-binding protein